MPRPRGGSKLKLSQSKELDGWAGRGLVALSWEVRLKEEGVEPGKGWEAPFHVGSHPESFSEMPTTE